MPESVLACLAVYKLAATNFECLAAAVVVVAVVVVAVVVVVVVVKRKQRL